jgi:tRNA A37 threonylcarbamoyladenosine dehydratase
VLFHAVFWFGLIMSTFSNADAERRFGGLARLYGLQAPSLLAAGHVVVAGIGGVGSWAAEALARSGVGTITLIDLDHIAESNVNRQVHALTSTLGQAKVLAMQERIQQINPGCHVRAIDDFVEPGNVADVVPDDAKVVLDCTDQIAAKVALVQQARQRKQALMVCGGAGGKTNPLALRTGDLSGSTNDALLARLRNVLRRQHGFPKPVQGARGKVPRMGVRVVWLDQQTLLPQAWAGQPQEQAPQGLSCAGYGSVVTVTAAMGLAVANEALHWLLHGRWPA